MEKREGREKPPAAGLANMLSSRWRCYREREWKSRAADSHVISYSLSLLGLSRPLYVCVCVLVGVCRNCATPGTIDLFEPVRRRSMDL